MKHHQKNLSLLMFVIFFSLTTMTGCQIFSPSQSSQNNISQAPQDRRIGVMKSLGGVSTNNQGTNLLIMDDGTTILLKSSLIHLDDPKYSEKRVEVSGVLTYTMDNKQIIDVQSIDILENVQTFTQTQSQAPEWKDYVNAGLGFRVKYRDDFKIEDDISNSVTFKKPHSSDQKTAGTFSSSQQLSAPNNGNSAEATIVVLVKAHRPDETLLKDFLNLADDKPATLFSAGITKSKIGMNSIDGYKSQAESGSIYFYIDADNRFYKISYMSGDSSQSMQNQTVFYDFLASFELLNKSSSSQEITATSAPFIVSVKSTTSSNSAQSPFSKSILDNATNAQTTVTSTNTTDSGSSPLSTPSTNTLPPITDSKTTTATNSSNPVSSSSPTGGTPELVAGFSSLTSSGYKFTMQYPKSWYYGQTSSTDTGIIRRYDFGLKPVDEQPGIVNLDLMSSSIPSGSTLKLGDKTIIRTSNGSGYSYYYQGSKRVYRLTGSAGMESTLETMIATFQEQ